MQEYEGAVEELKSRPTSKEDITLDPVKNALDSLGNPQESYDVILVGGTNGKGSTVEMISELLQSKGKDVGTTKSPHLTTIRERIKHNSSLISEEEFLRLYNKIENLDNELSFFEFLIVMAYLYFEEENVDYAVMEVGLGGRLDATNAADPEASVITNVAKDHTQFLGETREEIAEEKAGITPRNGKLITSSSLNPIEKKADERNTKKIEPEGIRRENGEYVYKSKRFEIPVEGSFQRNNLENALTTVEEIAGLPDDLGAALSGLSCPGRMEYVSKEPAVILDGAHNEAALRKIVDDLPEDFVCVFNAIETKNISEMVEILEQKASKFIFTKSNVPWSEEPEKIAKSCSANFEIEENPVKAVERGQEAGNPVVVTGSLYLIGNIKKIGEIKP